MSGANIVLAPAVAPYPYPAASPDRPGGGSGQDSLADVGSRPRWGQLREPARQLRLMRGPAPLAAIGTSVIPELFSARVRCHVFQPLEFGVDLGSFCLG